MLSDPLALLLVPPLLMHILLPMAEAYVVEDVSMDLILILLIVSQILHLILLPPVMIFIRSSIVRLIYLGSI